MPNDEARTPVTPQQLAAVNWLREWCAKSKEPHQNKRLTSGALGSEALVLAAYDALADQLERNAEALRQVEHMLVIARQLVDGWWQTTPANEWSEFDETTRQEMKRVHGLVAEAKC